MKIVKNICSLLLLFCIGHCVGNELFAQYSDSIKLNDVRILASHNSYKKKPDPKVLHFLDRFKKRLGDEMDPNRMDYGHVSLSEQFNIYGIRGIELDVYYDPKGGRFSKRRINLFITGKKQRIKDSVMQVPGFKMLHIADIDFETNYLTLVSALTEIEKWSNQNPGHTPLIINIEPKGDTPGDYSGFLRFLGFKRALKYSEAAYNALDAEIYSVFSDSSRLITPKDLQGVEGSISERINIKGWPTLNECLGKVIFVIDGDYKGIYKHFLEKGEDRPMFVYSEPGESTTAFVKRNNPIDHEEEISVLTSQYIVRTRSDVETMHARNNDYSMFNAAIRSEAQIISTDYYRADPLLGTFRVSLGENELNSLFFILRKH